MVKKKYQSNAERQQAYRERLKAKREAFFKGLENKDKENKNEECTAYIPVEESKPIPVRRCLACHSILPSTGSLDIKCLNCGFQND
jgi:hypothetical protein